MNHKSLQYLFLYLLYKFYSQLSKAFSLNCRHITADSHYGVNRKLFYIYIYFTHKTV